ncbi:MAG: PocR ligand-binding domain-containing protein [Planctomycetes bacterium]|nr:PocR ligand-binding domain-containing protein [Planctomycetota bacterium]
MKRLTGLSMALNSPCGAQSGMGAPGDPGNPLCSLIRATADGRRRCRECDLHHHRDAAAAGRPILYTCHAGFYDMAAPISVGGRHVATISSGQVLPERPSPAGLRRLQQRLRSYRIPARTLASAYRRAPWMDRDQLQQVTRLLELFAAQIGESGQLAHDSAARLGSGDLHRIGQLIDQRFADRAFSLAEAARSVGLSPAHFSHRFHRLSGGTFVHAVQSRRIRAAQHLLKTTEQRITAIALATGFDNPTHFNRVFRRIAGCTPTAWRRRSTASAA